MSAQTSECAPAADGRRYGRVYDLVRIHDDFYCASFSGNSWPTASNIFLFPDSDGLSLIDAGMDNPECFHSLCSCIQSIGRRVEDVHTILLTHGHPDHVGGANAVCTNSTPEILLSEDCIPEAVDPIQQDYYCLPPQVRDIARKMRNFDIVENFNQTCGSWLLDRSRVTAIREGAVIRLGRYAFHAIQTPGHDIGLMCFHEPDRKMIVTGDLLKSSGPGSALPWYTSTAGGVDAYLESLRRIERLEIETTLPAHGTLTGVFREMWHQTFNAILERESAIVSLLRSGPKSCEQLDAALYRPVLLELCPWFSTVTESHLVRLERSGVVRTDGLDPLFVLPNMAGARKHAGEGY